MQSISTVTSFEIEQKKNQYKLMLFDLSIYGHHPSYIQHLIRYWCNQKLSVNLNIVVSPQFIQVHSDVVETASECNQGNINFVAITQEEESALKSRKSAVSRNLRTLQEWDLFCKYASLLQATKGLIMYFDTCQLPLSLGIESPCLFSGIYFRPTFHYREFSNYLPSWRDRLQELREKFLLNRVLRHPQLQTLFCLDPFAVSNINKFHSKTRVVHIPDPVQIQQYKFELGKLRESLRVQPGKQVFLVFGSLTGRKGIYQLLEAIQLLSPELCQKLCLLFIGEANSTDKALISSQIGSICQSQPIQIIEHYEFVPEQDVQAYFQLADVVLAPYQRHVGMSGILLLAAAVQKPVLSSNYGLMGEIVQRYSLGLTVDSTKPDAIAKGLTRFLIEAPEELSDHTKMKSFAEQNSIEHFASVIFQHL